MAMPKLWSELYRLAPRKFYPAQISPGRIEARRTAVVKSRQQTARKPASKFAHLQKKMQKQKVQAKKKTGKKK